MVVRAAMNYCSLDDAFPSAEGVPSPGCTNEQAVRAARKEERRKMKRCKQGQDPDRQQYGKLPDVPAMNHVIGLREHTPDYAPQSDMDSSAWRSREKPAMMEPFESLIPLPTPNQPSQGVDTSEPYTKKSYFGSDPDDSFADYIPDQKDYQLQPDFLGSFEQTGLQKATGKASVLPAPSMNMYWKPTMKSGAKTSFIDNLSPPRYHSEMGPEPSMKEIMKRMDMLFAKLDDLNATTPEQMTSELLMFISSGIFVLFMMDLLVKKGNSMRF